MSAVLEEVYIPELTQKKGMNRKTAVSSFIYEMMNTSGRKGLIEEYCLQPFEAKVLEPSRIFREKVPAPN